MYIPSQVHCMSVAREKHGSSQESYLIIPKNLKQIIKQNKKWEIHGMDICFVSLTCPCSWVFTQCEVLI